VLLPKAYDAYYCTGACRFPLAKVHTYPHTHSHTHTQYYIYYTHKHTHTHTLRHTHTHTLWCPNPTGSPMTHTHTHHCLLIPPFQPVDRLPTTPVCPQTVILFELSRVRPGFLFSAPLS